MTSAEIRFRLDLAGISQRDLAVENGVGDAMISLTINGHRRTPRLRRSIAIACGLSYDHVWGELDPRAGVTPCKELHQSDNCDLSVPAPISATSSRDSGGRGDDTSDTASRAAQET